MGRDNGTCTKQIEQLGAIICLKKFCLFEMKKPSWLTLTVPLPHGIDVFLWVKYLYFGISPKTQSSTIIKRI